MSTPQSRVSPRQLPRQLLWHPLPWLSHSLHRTPCPGPFRLASVSSSFTFRTHSLTIVTASPWVPTSITPMAAPATDTVQRQAASSSAQSAATASDDTPSGFTCPHCLSTVHRLSAADTWYTVTAGRNVGVFRGWYALLPFCCCVQLIWVTGTVSSHLSVGSLTDPSTSTHRKLRLLWHLMMPSLKG
jgi:hypothetical protein